MRQEGRSWAGTAKQLVKRVVPRAAIVGVRHGYQRAVMVPTRVKFALTREKGEPLGREVLETLFAKYPEPPKYPYDPEALERRGEERAQEIGNIVACEAGTFQRFLEIGCWDGMVSRALALRGKTATATDVRSIGFDPRAAEAGVDVRAMDVSHLEFADEAFDCVISYDGFEHFPNPAAALAESVRVLRPGGILYISFGYPWLSPLGLHAYRSVPVPYVQILFSRETLEAFVEEKGLPPVDFHHVNGWTIGQFRALWKQYAAKLDLVQYEEQLNVTALELIRQYPSQFRAQSDDFEEFILTGMTLVFRKR